jgi:amidase
MTGVRLGDQVLRYPAMFKDTLHWEVERAAQLTAHEVGVAHVRLAEIQDRMRRFMERHEFFVLPVSQVPPFDVNLPYPMEVDGTPMETYIDWMRSCYLISVTGAPALSIPAGFTAEGLPVGIQIVAGHRRERALLEMGFAFEQAVGISRRLI